jgi:hypothetical protein
MKYLQPPVSSAGMLKIRTLPGKLTSSDNILVAGGGTTDSSS